jgi:serine/threonine protein kinase
MTPEQYVRVCELFQAAAPLDEAARAQLLERACNGDAWLRTEVERMLAGEQQGSDTDPAGGSPRIIDLKALLPNGLWLREYIGARIGPYLIERKLGSGGMGTVYLAQRTGDFRQHVAIKVIKAGHDAESTIARFRTERQLLANLNHPHIARLFDGGTTEDGLPYFVMEYIAGQSFDRYCADRQLSLAASIRLLKAVAEAVQYAHEHRVLHRDLKPGNILVTADGVPKIVDFGLAKHLVQNPDSGDQTLADHAGSEAATVPPRSLTHTGAILGTPSYMAPEQADTGSHSFGPAADIYALGAILYELLTGRPPFRGETPLDTLFQVLHDDPVPPRRLHPRLPLDLETICLKCLQKEPEKRYASAAELAEELGRFLAHKPILARPAGPWSRACKFARRNKALVGSVAAVFVALILGLTVASFGLFRAWEAEDRLRLDVFEAQERAALQQGDWKLALRLYDEALAADHPNISELRLKKARAHAALYERPQAQAELESLLQRPDLSARQEATLRLIRGDLGLSRFGGSQEALADIQKALDLGIEGADAFYARALLEPGAKAALAHGNDALLADPFHREAQYTRLMLLLLLGKSDDCRGRAQALAALTPRDPAPHVCLAWVDVFEGRIPEARARLPLLKELLGADQVQILGQVIDGVEEMFSSLEHGDSLAVDHETLSLAFKKLTQLREKFSPEANLEAIGLKLINAPCIVQSWGAFAASLEQAQLDNLQAAIDMIEPVLIQHPEGTFHYWHGHLLMDRAGLYAGMPDKAHTVPPSVQRAVQSFELAARQRSVFPRLSRDARFWGAWAESFLAKSRGRPREEEARQRAASKMHWFLAENQLRSASECSLLASLALERLEDHGLARSLLEVGSRLDPDHLDLQRVRAQIELASGALGHALEAIDIVLCSEPDNGAAKWLRQEILRHMDAEQKLKGSKP